MRKPPRKKRSGRKPFRWAEIDSSEMDRAVDREELLQAQRRFVRTMDARYGPGAGDHLLPKVFNHARWIAVRNGWKDAPADLGQWRRGVGWRADLPEWGSALAFQGD